MVKSILHTTDFSANAYKALQYAYNLSQKLNAALWVVHVAGVPTVLNYPYADTLEEMEETEKAAVIERIKNYCGQGLGMVTSLSNVNFDVKINPSAIDGILDAIKDRDTSLVVVGTKGQSKLKEVIMGSTTRKLVEKSPCPVLAIPETTAYSAFGKMIYASDFDGDDIGLLHKLVPFAKKLDASIRVLHVFATKSDQKTETGMFRQKLLNALENKSIEYDSLVSENVGEAIAEYIQEYKADLLVMYEKEKAGFIGRMFHKDLVKQFATHTQVPLLTFNSLNRAVDL